MHYNFNAIPQELRDLSKSGVYCIFNTINGKVYIGSTNNFKRRFHDHKKNLKGNRHHNIHLQKAVNIYKIENFEFLIIEYCEYDKLAIREQYWLDFYKSYDDVKGYNFLKNARTTLGKIVSEETKRKMSEAKKGKKLSPELIEQIRIRQTGKKQSEETIQKRINSRKLNNKSKKQRPKIKWPCPDSYYCKCDVCKAKRASYARAWRNKCK